jgi:hypothetical protein
VSSCCGVSEEILKEKYQSFVDGYLVSTLRDGMDLNKTFALRTAARLFSDPLQKAKRNYWSLTGQETREILAERFAASAGHELRRVLEEHENMQESPHERYVLH